MWVEYYRADPAGNITLLVTTPIAAGIRAEVAKRLMDRTDAEQVGFIAPPVDKNLDGRLEMMGGEFCANASRAAALLLSQGRRLPLELRLECSGCSQPLLARVDGGTVRLSVPAPRAVMVIESDCVRVDLEGISHFVVDRPPDEDFARRLLTRERDVPVFGGGLPEAMGVIFIQGSEMTPAVWVRGTDTLVWEGSCGSGAIACAAARLMARGPIISSAELTLRQPGGVLCAKAWREDGGVKAELSGELSMGEKQGITV